MQHITTPDGSFPVGDVAMDLMSWAYALESSDGRADRSDCTRSGIRSTSDDSLALVVMDGERNPVRSSNGAR